MARRYDDAESIEDEMSHVNRSATAKRSDPPSQSTTYEAYRLGKLMFYIERRSFVFAPSLSKAYSTSSFLALAVISRDRLATPLQRTRRVPRPRRKNRCKELEGGKLCWDPFSYPLNWLTRSLACSLTNSTISQDIKIFNGAPLPSLSLFEV